MRQLLDALVGKIWWRRGFVASAGLLQVTFIGLWIYAGALAHVVADKEAQATAIRNAYLDLMRSGADKCMDGVWPEGAVKGPTYKENGNRVTGLCSGVSGTLNYFGRFFHDNELWRSSPSLETARKFAATYEDTFKRSFEPFLKGGWIPPLSDAALTLASRVKVELAPKGHQVVQLKRDAGLAAARRQSIDPAVTIGEYWTLIVVASLVIWLLRGRRRFFH